MNVRERNFIIPGFTGFLPEEIPCRDTIASNMIRVKVGPFSRLDDRVCELVATLYGTDVIVYTHRTTSSGTYVTKPVCGDVHPITPGDDVRLVGHSAGCTVIARMIVLMAAHRLWMLRQTSSEGDIEQEQLASKLRQLPAALKPPHGPVFLDETFQPLDVRIEHIQSITNVCAVAGGVPYISHLAGYDGGCISKWSVAWFGWILLYGYERISRFLPWLRYIFDTYLQQEDFQGGVESGLIFQDFHASVTVPTFKVASTLLPFRSKFVVCRATTNIHGYHVVEPWWNPILFPFYWMFMLFAALWREANDGVAPVSSQTPPHVVQCNCSSSHDKQCAKCGTWYTHHDHVSVLYDHGLLNAICERSVDCDQ